MANARKNRSDEELRKMSDEHLLYEIKMLQEAARVMDKFAPPNETDANNEKDLDHWTIRNALVESFVTHARVLTDFLYDNRNKPDDAIAIDFFNDPNDWWKRRPKKGSLLEKTVDRVGKEIVHLSYRRLSVLTKDWPFVKIASEILERIQKFAEIVPQDRVSDNFRSFFAKAGNTSIEFIHHSTATSTGHVATTMLENIQVVRKKDS